MLLIKADHTLGRCLARIDCKVRSAGQERSIKTLIRCLSIVSPSVQISATSDGAIWRKCVQWSPQSHLAAATRPSFDDTSHHVATSLEPIRPAHFLFRLSVDLISFWFAEALHLGKDRNGE